MSHGKRGVISIAVLFAATLLLGASAPPVHDHAAMLAAEAANAAAASPPTGFWGKLFEEYVPRQVCMNNEPDVIWLSFFSDLAIALAYYSIPLALIRFVRQRRDMAFNWMFIAFALFILACGTTHVFNIIALWHPVYRLDGILKAITAVLSVITAIAMWPLIPKALAIPNPAALNAANEDLRRARASAEDASRAKSRFLANMSHEIRTPMSAIIGYTDMVLDPRQTPSDRLEYLNTIRRNGQHLLGIINEILDLSKIEAGKYVVERTLCNPAQVLSDVASLMRVKAAEKRILLEIENQGPIPTSAQTDPACLRQVLINLVSNAVKFTDKGRVKVTMSLEEPQAGAAKLRFDVCDTGIGIHPAHMERLFEPFAQGDESMTRRYGGTGLGLTISKRLVEMLGGEIAVSSKPGQGSCFSMTIDPGPLEGVPRVANWRECLHSTEEATPEHAPEQLSGRVLLVEDGADNRKLLSIYLEYAGLEVAQAENGREGYERAQEAARDGQPFDVIVMDMQMPVLDGYGAASLLREKGYEGVIIALTAHAMAEDRAKCLLAGCTEYLSKPVSRLDLLAMIGKYTKPCEKKNARAYPAVELPARQDARQEVIQSTADAAMKPLLESYVSELPARVAELKEFLRSWDEEKAKKVVHNLVGTGGLFGLMSVSTSAAMVEESIRLRRPKTAIAVEVEQLIDIVRSVEGYDDKGEMERTP